MVLEGAAFLELVGIFCTESRKESIYMTERA
jgi:hypothetical protein